MCMNLVELHTELISKHAMRRESQTHLVDDRTVAIDPAVQADVGKDQCTRPELLVVVKGWYEITVETGDVVLSELSTLEAKESPTKIIVEAGAVQCTEFDLSVYGRS